MSKSSLDLYPQHRCKCDGTSEYAHTLWCPARSWNSVAKTRAVGRAPGHVSKLTIQTRLDARGKLPWRPSKRIGRAFDKRVYGDNVYSQ